MGKDVKNLSLDELEAVNGGILDGLVSCDSSVLEEIRKEKLGQNVGLGQNSDSLLSGATKNARDLIPEKSFSGGFLEKG